MLDTEVALRYQSFWKTSSMFVVFSSFDINSRATWHSNSKNICKSGFNANTNDKWSERFIFIEVGEMKYDSNLAYYIPNNNNEERDLNQIISMTIRCNNVFWIK